MHDEFENQFVQGKDEDELLSDDVVDTDDTEEEDAEEDEDFGLEPPDR